MKHISKFIVAALAVTGFAGCSDEVEYNAASELPAGIYLTIPDPLSADVSTRALEGGDYKETVGIESKLTDLWLIAFDGNGNFFKSDDILEHLKPVKFANESGHQTYDITEWFQGSDGGDKYKLYVVANLGAYTSSTAWQEPANEAALQNTIMNFRNGETSYLLNHTNVKNNGLPMACLNSEVKVNSVAGQGLTVEPGGTARITANLKFLCSKVRYTILFDNGNDGFSHDVFGSRFVNFTSASVSGLPEETQTVGSDEGTAAGIFSLTNIALNSVEYPANPDSYPSTETNNDQRYVNLSEVANPTGSKRAWQGVVYLPANKDLTKPTTLNLEGDVDGKGSVKYTLPLLPNATSTQATKALKAGKYYDVVAKVTGLETIAINQPTVETDWNRTQLLYSLMQNLFLKVSATAMEKVEAGQTYTIAYETNGALSIEVPSYDGVDLFEYEIDASKNAINLWVNQDIKAEWYGNIMNGKAADNTDCDYKWIEIKTGGGIITKKIDITELDLHRFIRVMPDKMPINISELVASGRYDYSYDFEVETNVEKFWIEIENWPNNNNAASNHVWITDGDGNVVTFVVKDGTPTAEMQFSPNSEGVKKFKLYFKGLNNGYPIWESQADLKLNFKPSDSGDHLQAATYQVNIVPSRDTYIIHVKSKNDFLSKTPHCYIYQCLEIPSTYDKSWAGVALANWPVAGVDATNDWDDTKYNADVSALEYSFTGKIAFRGWDWPLNAETLKNVDVNNNHSKLNDNGWHHGHFIRFNGDWSELTNKQNRYNTGMDFFKQYREDVNRCKCDDCRTSYNTGWPGLITEEEADGWSKLELTGSATPGRALIIWTQNHGGGNQYPKQAGERLFDFPSKEAWIYIESDSKASPWFQTLKEANDYANSHK